MLNRKNNWNYTKTRAVAVLALVSLTGFALFYVSNVGLEHIRPQFIVTFFATILLAVLTSLLIKKYLVEKYGIRSLLAPPISFYILYFFAETPNQVLFAALLMLFCTIALCLKHAHRRKDC